MEASPCVRVLARGGGFAECAKEREWELQALSYRGKEHRVFCYGESLPKEKIIFHFFILLYQEKLASLQLRT